MKRNIGGLDRFFRLGIGFLSLPLMMIMEGGFLTLLFGVVALVGLGTALTGYCPISQRLGMDTTGRKDPE